MNSGTEQANLSRLLVVDDNQGQVRILTQVFQAEGFQVVGCHTGAEALDQVADSDVGVVILDQHLPDTTGTDLLSSLKRIAPDVSIIIYTGYGSFHSAKSAVNHGAFAYVEKGEELTELVECVRRAFLASWERYANRLEEAVEERTHRLVAANLDLRKEIEERQAIEGIIHKQRNLAVALASTTELQAGLQLALEAVLTISGLDSGGVYLVDQESGDLDLALHRGFSKDFVDSVTHYGADSEQAKLVEAGMPAYSGQGQLPPTAATVTAQEKLQLVAVLPIRHEGQSIACLNAASYTMTELSDTTRNAMEAIAAQLGSVLARLRAEQGRRESEKRYRMLVETADEGIVIVDTGETIVFANRAMADLLEYRVEELTGTNLLELADPREFAAFLVETQKRRAGRSSRYETVLHTKSGGQKTFHLSAVPLRDETETIIGTLGVLTDVTDKRRIQKELAEREKQLTHMSRLATMGEMATNLAHELKQPLHAITNYATGGVYRLRNRTTNPKELTDVLDRIVAQARRASNVIDHLRNSVRQREPRKVATNLNKSLREVLDLTDHLLHHAGVQLRLDLRQDSPLVRADPIQIQQVLVNLIANAVEAMAETPPEDKRLLVATSVADGAYAEVSISDTGPGLTEDVAAKLFTPFFTTKPEGLGMGLAISRTIIDAHEGRIWAESRSPRGAEFRFSLPLVAGRQPHGS